MEMNDHRTAALSMPIEKARLSYKRCFSSEEFKNLLEGFTPRDMDDKWFIFFENDHLYFHRSWTGVRVYDLTLAKDNGAYIVEETWVNRDKRQYNWLNDEEDCVTLDYLINTFLLNNRMVKSFDR